MRKIRGPGFALVLALSIGAMWGTTAFAQDWNGRWNGADDEGGGTRMEQRHHRFDRRNTYGNWDSMERGRYQYSRASSRWERGYRSAWNDTRGVQRYGRGWNQNPRGRHSRDRDPDGQYGDGD